MDRPMELVLAETHLEERDGATWVSGVCPFCGERFAFQAPPRGMSVRVPCPNGGHLLRITELTSAGRHAHPGA